MTKTIILSIWITLLSASCSTMNKDSSSASNQNKPKVPNLKSAEVKTIWIPDKIEGNRYEEGHYLHVIDKQTTWRAE